MDANQKEAIKADLERLFENSSANRVATRMGVSPATLSQVRNGNWELIADDMWRKIAAGIKSLTYKTTIKFWKILEETSTFRRLTDIFSDAQEGAQVFAVCGDAGCGKSATAKAYADSKRNVYVLSCNDFWTRKIFLQELLRSLGRNSNGETISEMVYTIVDDLKKADSPLIILDEADKLSDSNLYFLITLYNQIEDYCGLVLMATDYLEKMMRRGLRLKKKGYKEIYSRVGKKIIVLPLVSNDDIIGICRANGINDKSLISDVVDDCENDLRRVRRKVFAVKKRNNRE